MSDKKRKILHLITGLETGGAEMMLCRILPLLNDFEHVVCTLAAGGELSGRITKLGLPLYQLNGGKHFSLSSIIAFRRILKKERPDIISTRLIHADIFGRIFGRLFGVKNIICIAESVLEQKKYKLFFYLEKLTSRLVTNYATVSKSVYDRYKKYISDKIKIRVIYNGIDTGVFVGPPDKTEARKLLGFDENDILIGYTAKLRPERNHKILLESLKQILLTKKNVRLMFAGAGPEESVLKEITAKLNIENNVLFLGLRTDVPLILRSLDIFVSPSYYEGMSVAILEAMAAGLPIIASDIAPNRELIEDKKDGYLVPPDDAAIIAEKILFLINNETQRKVFSDLMREKSLQFNIKETAKKLTALYAE